jgi:uncharacterized protein
MKRTIITVLAIACSIIAFAQTDADYNTAVARFKTFYNNQQHDSIYAMMSDRAKGLMPLDKTKQTFTQLNKQLGELKSSEFMGTEETLHKYKASFANATVILVMALNNENKFETFRFLPYDEKADKHEKSNFVLKTATGNIYGTLSVPAVDSRQVPVVLIVAGSGPTDRDGNNPMGVSANSYKMLADSLNSRNIATLRYDKRGIGESADALKDASKLSFEDMVNDAAEIVKVLKQDKRFSKVIVLGHSEGSLIGMIAVEREKADAYISVSGLAERADKIIIKQISVQSMDMAQKAKIILDSLKAGYTVKNVDPDLEAIFNPAVQHYISTWLKYEPKEEIKKLKIPILIVQGTTDIQVSVDEADRLKRASPYAALLIIKGMSHILKQGPENREANLATYSIPTLPLSPELIPGLAKFILNIAK